MYKNKLILREEQINFEIRTKELSRTEHPNFA